MFCEDEHVNSIWSYVVRSFCQQKIVIQEQCSAAQPVIRRITTIKALDDLVQDPHGLSSFTGRN